MSRAPQSSESVLVDIRPLQPRPPGWVVDLLDEGRATPNATSDAVADGITSRGTQDATLLSVGVPNPESRLGGAALADAVTRLYAGLGRELARQHRYPIRIWNFVPDIQAATEAGEDRYMAFNRGRFVAYCDWFGGPEAFRMVVPTSSAVGITGDTLWVHVLAGDAPGTPVENPRQIPSYQYSRRYGPRPPCFARATKFNSRLLIGGTASILGERSRHLGDIVGQTRETLENIAALVEAGAPGSCHAPLRALRNLRVHLLDPQHAPMVQAMLEEATPALTDVEFVQAPLCRKELLVEIEGTADCL